MLSCIVWCYRRERYWKQKSQGLLEIPENPDPSSPSTVERISYAASTSIYVFLLHLWFSRECEKCGKGARERERERKVNETLSLFSQSNRGVYLGTTVCPWEFFSRVLDSLLCYGIFVVLLRIANTVLAFLLLACCYTFREVEVNSWYKMEEPNFVIITYSNILFNEKGSCVGDLNDRCGWSIKAVPRLALRKFSRLNSTSRSKVA